MASINLNTAMALRATDANGAPVPGAKLYLFAEGTTTAVTTYSDEALTTANAHPVVAGSSGAFGPIYVSPGAYKVDVRTAAHVSLPGYPVDDIIVGSTGATPIETRAAITTTRISSSVDAIRTAGYATQGDGGAGLYKRAAIEPSHAAKVQSADRAWWELVPDGACDIRQLGAVADGITVNTTAIQNAIDAFRDIYIPPTGNAFITRTIRLPSNRRLFGVGAASLLKRDPAWTGSNNIMVRIGEDGETIENVTVEHIGIDMAGVDEFGRGIQIGNPSGMDYTTRNVRVRNNRIYDFSVIATTGDKWAILLRSILENIWIEGNHSSDDMQLVAGGTRDITNLYIRGNRCVDGYANGIAISAPNLATIKNVVISENIIEAHSLCIFVGPDGNKASAAGSWDSITVANNICRPNATPNTGWMGIWLNTAKDSYTNISVTGNIIVRTGPRTSEIGIRADDTNDFLTRVSGLVIVGNVMENLRFGVDIVRGADVNITGNVFRQCDDGVFLRNVTAGSLVADNKFYGCQRAVHVKNASSVLVKGNHTRSASAGGVTGNLTLAPDTGETAEVFAIGNKFTDGGTNVWGVHISGLGTSTLDLVDNDLRDNTAGTVSGTPTSARGNFGYVTEHFGNASVTPNASGNATIAHGLHTSPTFANVNIRGRSNSATVESVDATNLTIFIKDASGAPVTSGTFTVDWEAARKT